MNDREPQFEVFQGKERGVGRGEPDWYWRLRAANGEIVAQSEGYTREEDAKRGAIDARRAAVHAADKGSTDTVIFRQPY